MNPRRLHGEDFEAANDVFRSLHFKLSTPETDPTFGLGDPLVATSRLQRLEGGSVELGGIWVDPARRGEGLARKMTLFAMEQSSAEEVLYCVAFDHLVDFYLSCGFTLAEPSSAPRDIRDKLEFCACEKAAGRYEHAVVLMERPASGL